MVKGIVNRLYAVQELVGEEMSFLELDNKMQEIGFYSVIEDGTEENCLADGNAVFTAYETLECEVQVLFDVTVKNSDDEVASCSRVKITNVCKF